MEALERYRAGEVLLWPRFVIPHQALFEALPIHTVEKHKKLKSKNAQARIGNPAGHALSVFTKEAPKLRAIQAAMVEVETVVRDFVRANFPCRWSGLENHTWRYTETRNEPLHFDVWSEEVAARSPLTVRVFLNLDRVARVWDVGPELLAFCSDAGIDVADRNEAASRATKRLTEAASCRRTEFAPGDLWMVDSQRRSHAVIYGRRMASFAFETANDLDA